MERYELVKRFKDAVDHMITLKEGCYFWWLDTDNNGNDWAIVLGWADGFEGDDEDDALFDQGWHLCAKVAYQPHNSIMQCDYDIDWTMPYDEKSGEVWNTDTPIVLDGTHDMLIDWFLNEFEEMKKALPCWKEEE